MIELELTIDSALKGPVYLQIAERIRGAIHSGQLKDGVRLPAIRSLAASLDVNRDTVAAAYEALASQGLIESAVGRGTFVCDPGMVRPVSAPALAVEVERLLTIENGRSRFGASEDVLPMHSLVPDPDLYPVEEFRRALNRALVRGGPELLLYGSAQGHQGLRNVLASRFGLGGREVCADDIVLCHGASQGILLALRAFASSGDAVAVEVPTYHNVLVTLASIGVRPEGVSMTAAGPDLGELERVLSRDDVKAFYTIPTFHNPMGITTSLTQRRELLELARRLGKPVIEDSFESDLRISGRQVPALAALDDHGQVVHLHSFSKSLFPGMRIGSVMAKGRVVDGVVALKHATDLADSMPLQAGMAEFLETGAYDRHLGRIRRELRSRHRAMAEALAEHMPEGTKVTRPDGGYQVWIELPFAIDTRDLLADAVRAGMLFSPGAHFMPGGGPSRCLRLTLAQVNAEQIRMGVEALGKLIGTRLDGQADTRVSASLHL